MALLRITILLLMTTSLYAQNYQLGEARYAGSGCPVGSASVALTPDGQSISFLFDRFTGSTTVGQRGLNLNCQIIIPVSITRGYSLDTTTIYYSGFFSAPTSNHGLKLATSGTSIQRMAPRFNTSNVITGPFQNNFSIEQKVINGIPHNPKCPKDPNLHLIISAELIGKGAVMSFTLDSADIGSAGLVVALAIKPCRP